MTDEWDARGVQQGREYAILTDEITKAWSGMNTRQYKSLKGLKKENLRDNMTGGKVAGDARKAIEQQTGVPVITSKNAAQLNQVVTNLIESAKSFADGDKKSEK